MRFVVIGPAPPLRGGIAHHTAGLAAALAAAGHAPLVVSFRRLYPPRLYPGRRTSEPSADAAPSAPPETHRLLVLWWPPTWAAARAAARAHRPALVAIQWWVPFFAPMAAWLAWRLRRDGLRVAFVCHNVLPHEGGGRLDRALVALALGRADAWLTHSRSDAAVLEALLGPARAGDGRAVRVPLPLVAPASSGPPPTRAAARAALGVPADAPLALFLGFVRPYKGLDVLLAALPAARAAVPGLRAWVAGEFWEPVERHRAAAEALGVGGAVTFEDAYLPGADVDARLAAADVCVLPYRSATQSAIATLALARGVPVVATRVGGLPDAVRDEVDGLLVPPADPAALAAALARFFGAPGVAARLRAGAEARRGQSGWPSVVAALEAMAEGASPP